MTSKKSNGNDSNDNDNNYELRSAEGGLLFFLVTFDG